MHRTLVGSFVCWLLVSSWTWAQEPFSKLVGNAPVGPVKAAKPVEIPYITWGGDVATFHANGGLNTKSDSIYGKQGLQIKLTAGDDFVGQVKNYLAGRTPFLRGTFRMLGQASEVLGTDPNTKPVVIMQHSWSAGDHIVSRQNLKTLNDLRSKNGKKVRIACQQGGPHVGLLYDSLDVAKIPRGEIEIVWVSDLTGPDGAAEAFRQDATIDACCVITPDMLGLTGGVDSTGSGAEGTVAGALVLNSTQVMSRSIADVYAVRSDWFKANRAFVEKFVSGYLKASEDVVALVNDFEKSGTMKPAYRQLLTMSQQIFGQEVLPTLEVDAHGLLLDCSFVGMPGQLAFFEDSGNLNGFTRKMAAALDLATGWGYAKSRFGFSPPGFDYEKLAKLSGVKYARPAAGESRFSGEGDTFLDSDQLDDRTIVSFTINFGVNEAVFSADQYGAEFNRAIQAASTFGNAVVMIRGHADPTKTLGDFVRAGIEKNIIKRTGQRGNFRYFLRGRQLDLTQTDQIIKLVQTGAFEGKAYRPRQVLQAALNLSQSRAEAVKNSVVAFASQQGVNLDAKQIQPVGAGVAEPIVPRPTTREEAAENRRVEFRIVRVPAEALNESDFDF